MFLKSPVRSHFPNISKPAVIRWGTPFVETARGVLFNLYLWIYEFIVALLEYRKNGRGREDTLVAGGHNGHRGT